MEGNGGGGEWGENENFSNAIPFLHMQGPFVPNFSEIGQLVKKVPLRGTWTPPLGGKGEEIQKTEKNVQRECFKEYVCQIL